MAEEHGPPDEASPLLRIDRPDPAPGRPDEGPLHDAGLALGVQERDQRFAHRQLADGLLGVELGVGPQGLGRHPDGLLVARREGPQGVLDAVPELAQDDVGNVKGILGDEEDAHALGPDEPDDLFDLLQQGGRDIVEQQMRLVEEEDQLGLVQVAHLGQVLEELGQEPEQERGVKLGLEEELVRGQDVDHPPPPAVGLDEVLDGQGRLAEKLVRPLALQVEQGPLDGPDRSRRDAAQPGRDVGRVLGDVTQHLAQVLDVEQKEPVLVGHPEGDRQDARLDLVQAEDPAQQERAHLAHRRPDGVPLRAVDVPERHRAALEREILELERLDPLRRLAGSLVRTRQAGQVAFDVGHEDRHAGSTQAFGQDLQRDRLAGAGGPRDQTVPIGHARQEEEITRSPGDEEPFAFVHGWFLSCFLYTPNRLPGPRGPGLHQCALTSRPG